MERRRGSPPHATLVQLALWLPPGCRLPGGGGGHAVGGCCVLLLDMLALPQASVKPILQALLRLGTRLPCRLVGSLGPHATGLAGGSFSVLHV